jgi:hypothetical protein
MVRLFASPPVRALLASLALVGVGVGAIDVGSMILSP